MAISMGKGKGWVLKTRSKLWVKVRSDETNSIVNTLCAELGQFGIDRAGYPLPSGIDEMAYIGKQSVKGDSTEEIISGSVVERENIVFYWSRIKF